MRLEVVCYSVDKRTNIVGNADYWLGKKEHVNTLWKKPGGCPTAYLLEDHANKTLIHIFTVPTGTTGFLYLIKD